MMARYVQYNGYSIIVLMSPCIPPFMKADRFSEHGDLENRKLLWHGTNVAVVAAILKSGLRIMPHSGGRVGRGIYFASENSKSASYGEQVERCGQCVCVCVVIVQFGVPNSKVSCS